MGPIVAEIFEGPHYGSIFGTITVALIGGGAMGSWITGVIHDVTGSYKLAFVLAIACCVISATAIWIAGPRKVRLVPGLVRSGSSLFWIRLCLFLAQSYRPISAAECLMSR